MVPMRRNASRQFCVWIYLYMYIHTCLILHQLNRGMLSRFWELKFLRKPRSIYILRPSDDTFEHKTKRIIFTIFTVYRSGPSCHRESSGPSRPAYERMFNIEGTNSFCVRIWLLLPSMFVFNLFIFVCIFKMFFFSYRDEHHLN